MPTAEELAVRLSDASVRKIWDPYHLFEWPDELLPEDHWYMSPELISIYGTDVWEGLDETQRKRLSFYELVNLFSFVLLGERLLIEGMINRTYRKATRGAISDYLHHFVDEENKHMIMFSTFCNRYAEGGVYPEKKIAAPREMPKGGDEVGFFCKALIVEMVGDVYNVKMMRDARIHPLVAQINKVHHIDEARHIAFGGEYVREVFDRVSKEWTPDDLRTFQNWLAQFLVSSWGDFYNPSVYRDAGLEDGYGIRKMALAHSTCRTFREDVSADLVHFFLDVGLLDEAPQL